MQNLLTISQQMAGQYGFSTSQLLDCAKPNLNEGFPQFPGLTFTKNESLESKKVSSVNRDEFVSRLRSMHAAAEGYLAEQGEFEFVEAISQTYPLEATGNQWEISSFSGFSDYNNVKFTEIPIEGDNLGRRRFIQYETKGYPGLDSKLIYKVGSESEGHSQAQVLHLDESGHFVVGYEFELSLIEGARIFSRLTETTPEIFAAISSNPVLQIVSWAEKILKTDQYQVADDAKVNMDAKFKQTISTIDEILLPDEVLLSMLGTSSESGLRISYVKSYSAKNPKIRIQIFPADSEVEDQAYHLVDSLRQYLWRR